MEGWQGVFPRGKVQHRYVAADEQCNLPLGWRWRGPMALAGQEGMRCVPTVAARASRVDDSLSCRWEGLPRPDKLQSDANQCKPLSSKIPT